MSSIILNIYHLRIQVDAMNNRKKTAVRGKQRATFSSECQSITIIMGQISHQLPKFITRKFPVLFSTGRIDPKLPDQNQFR